MIWDFDGTLARRIGNWRGAMIEVLDSHHAGHGVTMEQLSPLIRNRFPWDQEQLAHPELTDPEEWWQPMQAMLADAFAGAGYGGPRSHLLAARVRERFVDHTVSWELFADTLPVLDQLSQQGWEHVVLSNHVPELPGLIRGLGLDARFRAILTSAAIGYEKPHPHAFELAREAAGTPPELWMVGDNAIADVRGAEAAGIPAIQVRTEGGLPGLAAVPAEIARLSARSGGGR